MSKIELRWLVRRNQVTAEQVRAYRDTHCVSIMDAKKILCNENAPILQWREGARAWEEVPMEFEMNPLPKEQSE